WSPRGAVAGGSGAAGVSSQKVLTAAKKAARTNAYDTDFVATLGRGAAAGAEMSPESLLLLLMKGAAA
ncbi:hypothetical protein GW17_00046141, partial [Ensete ventricosum]